MDSASYHDKCQFKKMFMKILHKILLKKVGSHATLWTSLWRSSDAPKCLEDSQCSSASVRTTDNTVRTPFRVKEEIGFLSQTRIKNSNRPNSLQIHPDDHLCREPSDGSNKYPSGRAWQHHPDALQFLGRFCTCLIIFTITLYLSIGLRQNWCRWKANKKWYNLTIQMAHRNIRMAQLPDGKIKRPDTLQNSRSFEIPFQTQKQLTVRTPKTAIQTRVPKTPILTRIRTCKAYK